MFRRSRSLYVKCLREQYRVRPDTLSFYHACNSTSATHGVSGRHVDSAASHQHPSARNPPPSTSACVSIDGLPDHNCTPGAIDPRVTQDNIQQTICVSGYTSTVRPPTSYTTPLKVKQMAQYGLTGSTSDYEEDHLIPLEIGGNPTDPDNLWPEPCAEPNGARDKDKVENSLHDKVCSGEMTLGDAQNAIAVNWETASVGASTGSSQPTLPPPPPPASTPARTCCKICTNSKACGDSCISKNYTCHQPPGCACDAN